MTGKFIVITTINKPSEAVAAFAAWRDWQLVVVGDNKTPNGWHLPGVIYLDLQRQHREFGDLAKALPQNSYTRKILGYAYAVRSGAAAIFETDDDNIPYPDAKVALDRWVLDPNRADGDRIRGETGWLNVYACFGAPGCWPRGFPLDKVLETNSTGTRGSGNQNWSVMQFLADDDPDVDAIYRMVVGKPIRFVQRKTILPDIGTWSPFNSQATLWLPDAFPLMFLPIGVSDRVTDILRGIVATSCLWKLDRIVAFASPIVYQLRNEHNLLKDFQQEIPLYENVDKWAKLLQPLEGNDPAELCRSALGLVFGSGPHADENVHAYRMFLTALGHRPI